MINMVDLDAVADAVLAAHAVVEKFGTHEMKAISRTLLFTVGRDIAQCSRLTAEQQDIRYDEPERS